MFMPARSNKVQVGDSLVSAQMAFLGRDGNVWIVDKTENNPAQINGHPVSCFSFRYHHLLTILKRHGRLSTILKITQPSQKIS